MAKSNKKVTPKPVQEVVKIVCQVCNKEVKDDYTDHAKSHKEERRKEYLNQRAEFSKKYTQSLRNRKVKVPEPIQQPSMGIKFIRYVDGIAEDTIMV